MSHRYSCDDASTRGPAPPPNKDVSLNTPLKTTGKDGDEFTAAAPATLPEEYGGSESQQRRQIIQHIQADPKQDRCVDVDGGNFAKTR